MLLRLLTALTTLFAVALVGMTYEEELRREDQTISVQEYQTELLEKSIHRLKTEQEQLQSLPRLNEFLLRRRANEARPSDERRR